jgi:hypothetical protein
MDRMPCAPERFWSFIFISPSPSSNQGGFDARLGDRLIVERSRTPFCDSARVLLAENLARDERLPSSLTQAVAMAKSGLHRVTAWLSVLIAPCGLLHHCHPVHSCLRSLHSID